MRQVKAVMDAFHCFVEFIERQRIKWLDYLRRVEPTLPATITYKMDMETCREKKNKVIRSSEEGGATLPAARATTRT